MSVVNMDDFLTKKQQRSAMTKPDIIWQFSQHLKDYYKSKGQDVAVYVSSKVSINGGNYYTLIDSNVDLASVEWHHLKHHDWILPSKQATE